MLSVSCANVPSTCYLRNSDLRGLPEASVSQVVLAERVPVGLPAVWRESMLQQQFETDLHDGPQCLVCDAGLRVDSSDDVEHEPWPHFPLPLDPKMRAFGSAQGLVDAELVRTVSPRRKDADHA